MNKSQFIEILQNPSKVINLDSNILKEVVEKYPYFQTAKALYLKQLKLQGSTAYNNFLKLTATQTISRTVLFEFIAENQLQSAPPTHTLLNSTQKTNLKEVEPPTPIQSLKIGQPLQFNTTEKHSFSEWLTLSSLKPIERENKNQIEPSNKSDQNLLIDSFIATNPKISKPSKIKESENLSIYHSLQTENNSALMTQTLARVYLEQKKYKEAIKAYQILSLKYPEKSSFFASQVKKIKALQKSEL